MKFKLQVVSSKFHSCRLRFSWTPQVNGTLTAIETLQQESNVISHVFDVVDDTEIEIRVPYLSYKPFQRVDWSNNNIGYVILTLVNSLTHPNSPVPDINFLLWHAMCEDYEPLWPDPLRMVCAGQINPVLDPNMSNHIQDSKYACDNSIQIPPELLHPEYYSMSNDHRDSKRVWFNSNDSEEDKYPSLPRVQAGQISMGTASTPLMPGSNGLAIGVCGPEHLTNVYDLMRRPYWSEALTTANLTTLTKYSMVKNFFPGNCDLTTGTDANTTNRPSFMTYFSKLFRFYRGSFVLRVIRVANAGNTGNYYIGLAEKPTMTRTEFLICQQSACEIFPSGFTYPISVSVPYFTDWFCLPMPSLSDIQVRSPFVDTCAYAGLAISGSWVSTTSDDVYINAGDDYHVGGWVGTPLTLAYNVHYSKKAKT